MLKKILALVSLVIFTILALLSIFLILSLTHAILMPSIFLVVSAYIGKTFVFTPIITMCLSFLFLAISIINFEIERKIISNGDLVESQLTTDEYRNANPGIENPEAIESMLIDEQSIIGIDLSLLSSNEETPTTLETRSQDEKRISDLMNKINDYEQKLQKLSLENSKLKNLNTVKYSSRLVDAVLLLGREQINKLKQNMQENVEANKLFSALNISHIDQKEHPDEKKAFKDFFNGFENYFDNKEDAELHKRILNLEEQINLLSEINIWLNMFYELSEQKIEMEALNKNVSSSLNLNKANKSPSQVKSILNKENATPSAIVRAMKEDRLKNNEAFKPVCTPIPLTHGSLTLHSDAPINHKSSNSENTWSEVSIEHDFENDSAMKNSQGAKLTTPELYNKVYQLYNNKNAINKEHECDEHASNQETWSEVSIEHDFENDPAMKTSDGAKLTTAELYNKVCQLYNNKNVINTENKINNIHTHSQETSPEVSTQHKFN